jgi:hypothetical protein
LNLQIQSNPRAFPDQTLERDLSYFDYSNYDPSARIEAWDALDSMDSSSIPRRPHKSPAHTVKDQWVATNSLQPPKDLSSEGAAYYTSHLAFVNDSHSPFPQNRGTARCSLDAAIPASYAFAPP